MFLNNRKNEMGILENQLETWSRQGATTSASDLYQRIKDALENDQTLKGRSFEIFLQGSYRNSTNIRGDSDVDVVVMLTDTYMPEYGALDEYNKNILKSKANPATYKLRDFRTDVLHIIEREFSSHKVEEGGKSIKIPRTGNNIPADIVPCLKYRYYLPPKTLLSKPTYIEGLWIWDVKRKQSAISYPKKSYENGVTKQGRTSNWYKPTVRMLKNARGWLEDNNFIKQGLASSHSLECLAYNVPDYCFGNSYGETFSKTLQWLQRADLSNFVSQNGFQRLFQSGRWTEEDAHVFIGALNFMSDQWKK